ncbi:MAG: family 20 glycosylhydrolase [Ekhidna sp.]
MNKLNPFVTVYSVWILLMVCAGCDTSENSNIALIPKPTEQIAHQGLFKVDKNTRLVFDETSSSLKSIVQEYLNSITAFELAIDSQAKDNTFCFKVSDMPQNEYRLIVSEKSIELTGGSNQALLNGFQSIRQLLLINDGKTVPAMEVVDSPRFQWRGLLLDCSRHFMEKDFVKRYIDLLALYKMNVLHWHLTEDQGWRIEIDKYPKLTEIGAWRDDGKGGKYGGFYSKDDIREIVEYASNREVTIVPEIELPGHSQAALAAYPQFSCTGGPFEVETDWGVFKEIYCAGNDSTFMFLEDVLEEVIELFPSEYIHIGGDEVPKYRWEHCVKCQRRMQVAGLHDAHELQSYFISRIGDFLASKGKKMIGWDEILEGGLPDGATVQSWRGFEGAKDAVRLGNRAIVSPTSHAYFDYGLNDIDLAKVYGFNPIPEGVSEEERRLIIGGEANMWSERAPQPEIDSKVFPRLIAMSEVLWSGEEKKNFGEFRARLSNHYRMLDKLGVHYGFETVPVQIETNTESGVLEVSLTSYDSSIIIYYFDGVESHVYHESQEIMEPVNWAITFEKESGLFKDTIYQRFEPHLANGLKPNIATKYSANYAAGGIGGITDGLKGSNQFRDGKWQGYWGDDVVATLDLGEIKSVSQLSSGFLQYNNAWIFFPTEVTYEISTDGIKYISLGTILNKDSPRNKEQKTQEYSLTIDEKTEGRFVRIIARNLGVCPDWHDAAGSKAWLFIDEFSVK